MTNLRTAAQQALEALERCVSTCFDQYAHEQVMSRPEHFVNQTITALRAALAEPVQEPVKFWPLAPLTGYYDVGGKRVWLEKDEPFPAPPQRKPLTEEEIIDAVREADLDWTSGWTLDETQSNRFVTLARAIERAHGIGEQP